MPLQLVFVLVGATHPGNIGAAARAMKTMGYTRLRLVNACSHLTRDALARAAGAEQVLSDAVKFESLDAAVADCQHVIGVSARVRYVAVPLQNCRDVADELAVIAQQFSNQDDTVIVALVFGRERSGLTNDELDRCNRHLRIPCNPDFSSLNLGSAVQVVAYDCALALAAVPQSHASNEMPSNSQAMQHFFEHLQRVMINTGFLDPAKPRHLMRRLRGYFERNRPTEKELNILRGVLSATEQPRPPANAVVIQGEDD